jgi:hypothetical protein
MTPSEESSVLRYNGLSTMNGIVFESDGTFVKASRTRGGIHLRGRQLPSLFGLLPWLQRIPILKVLVFMVDAFILRPIYLLDWAYALMLFFAISIPYLYDGAVAKLAASGLISPALLLQLGNFSGLILFATVIAFFRFSGVATYHAAEHKAGNYYDELIPEDILPSKEYPDFAITDVAAKSRIHPRCGTNVMVPALLMLLIVGLFVDSIWVIFIVLALTLELIGFAARHRDRRWARLILAPGMLLQRLTTKECGNREIEIGTLALRALIEMKVDGVTRLDRTIPMEEK